MDQVLRKLAKHYPALESENADLEDLGPRLKVLRAQQRDLERSRDEFVEAIDSEGTARARFTRGGALRERSEGPASECVFPGAEDIRSVVHQAD